MICVTEFSKVLPIEDGEIYVSLTKGRPSANDIWSSEPLQDWILATNIRLRLIQTKTMLGHLMSVAQGDRTVTRRVCSLVCPVWKFDHFSVTQILREIKFGNCEVTKVANFDRLVVLISVVGFTQNLSDRKILNIPHRVCMLLSIEFIGKVFFSFMTKKLSFLKAKLNG